MHSAAIRTYTRTKLGLGVRGGSAAGCGKMLELQTFFFLQINDVMSGY